jgi:hypothetical protein
VNAIGDESMRHANRLVDIDGLSPEIAAGRLGRKLEAPRAARRSPR